MCIFSQEEALEEVSAQGRSTDMSLDVFHPPDISYPKHPPLDNLSFQAMALANKMMADLENNSVISSGDESFPQDSQMSTYSLDSPASATSSQSLKKPPHTPSSREGTHTSNPAVLSPPSSNPSLYQPGKFNLHRPSLHTRRRPSFITRVRLCLHPMRPTVKYVCYRAFRVKNR